MKKNFFSCLLAIYLIFALNGTAAASFSESHKASVSFSAGSVEMEMRELSADATDGSVSLSFVNQGTIAADLWLQNIYGKPNPEPEDNVLSKPDKDKGSDETTEITVTVEVLCKDTTKSLVVSGLENFGEPILVFEDLKPGSEAVVNITQNGDFLNENTDDASASADSEKKIKNKQIFVPVLYSFEFILKRGTFTSLSGVTDVTLTKLVEASGKTDGSDTADEKMVKIPELLTDIVPINEPAEKPGSKDEELPKDSIQTPATEIKNDNADDAEQVSTERNEPEDAVDTKTEPADPQQNEAVPNETDEIDAESDAPEICDTEQ